MSFTFRFFTISIVAGFLVGCSSRRITYSCSVKPITTVSQELSELCKKKGINYEYKTSEFIGNWTVGRPRDFGAYEAYPGDLDRYPPDKPVGIPNISVDVTNETPERVAEIVVAQHPSLVRVTYFDEHLAIFHPRGCWEIPAKLEIQNEVTRWSAAVHGLYKKIRQTDVSHDDICHEVLSIVDQSLVNDIMLKKPTYATRKTQQQYIALIKYYQQNHSKEIDENEKQTILNILSERKYVRTLFNDDEQIDRIRLDAEILLWENLCRELHIQLQASVGGGAEGVGVRQVRFDGQGDR